MYKYTHTQREYKQRETHRESENTLTRHKEKTRNMVTHEHKCVCVCDTWGTGHRHLDGVAPHSASYLTPLLYNRLVVECSLSGILSCCAHFRNFEWSDCKKTEENSEIPSSLFLGDDFFLKKHLEGFLWSLL